MTKHTPGPWHVDAQYICRADGVAIADVWQSMEVSGEDTEANARLIAAAPDLLTALEELLPYVTGSMRSTTDPLVEAARAAIAAARGEG